MRAVTPWLHAHGGFVSTNLVGDADELRPWAAEHCPGAQVVPISAPRYSWRTEREWRRVSPALPRHAVVWFPHWDLPFAGQRWPNVVTVHDLIPLLVPATSSALRRVAMRWWLRRALAGATRVATPSAATAQVLHQHFGVAGAAVIHNGADLRLGRDAVTRSVGVTAPYLLVVANRKPHKGLDVAIRAFAALRAQWPNLRLVVCGERFAHWGTLRALATSLGVDHAIDDAGVVDDATLWALYAQAVCLLAPARMEGFGLPVAEALRAGCPVVASRIPAHVEVAGDAALWAAVDDHHAMAAAVRTLLSDPAQRAALIAAGRARGARFTWAAAATAMRHLLHEAAQVAPRPT
jgi:glycosyltransferase involved in cell wall biosynthesis